MPVDAAPDQPLPLEARARRSGGTSRPAIYRMVARALEVRNVRGETLLDVGCGTGQLWPFLRHRFSRYGGVDAVEYDGFPSDGSFVPADLNEPLPASLDLQADAVVAIETIEHLENPRHLMRSMVRAVRPEGWIVVTTPNQRSLLSLGTLVVKGHFSAFQDGEYPAHLTALLDVDLRRIAAENGVSAVEIEYSAEGRVAFTPCHYPSFLSRLFQRTLSDNVLLIGRVCNPADPGAA